MVNGSLSRRTEWTVTVIARRAGDVSVPEIRFGNARSEPFSLTVLAGRSRRPAGHDGGELQLEVDAQPRNPYVQAQVVFTIRLLHQVALRNGQLEDPKLVDAMIQKLGEDRRYQIERDGRRYGVIERRFAVFPQKSGPLRIEPIGLEAELSVGGGSMFDQFFGGQGRVRKVRSEPVTLQVRPIPSAFKGRHWLPAADLRLTQAWSSDPPSTKVGEPITRTLSVRGEGVTMGMLPELVAKGGAIAPDLKQYPDQPALSEEAQAEGLVSVRREKTALIPMKDGSFAVPGVEIPWWNTRTDKLEVARIDGATLGVLPSPHAEAPPSPQDDELDASGLIPPSLAQASDTARPASIPAIPLRSNPWFWATWFIAAGWLATVAAWYIRSARSRVMVRPDAVKQASPDFSPVLKRLKRAWADRDADAARRAILHWGAVRWRSSPPASVEVVAGRLGGKAPVLIAAVNRALYGRGEVEWNGEELYQGFGEASRADSGKEKAEFGSGELESLYRSPSP
jgi:hypothetical protein